MWGSNEDFLLNGKKTFSAFFFFAFDTHWDRVNFRFDKASFDIKMKLWKKNYDNNTKMHSNFNAEKVER